MKIVISVTLILSLTLSLMAAEIDIESGLYNENIDIFFINDFNLMQSGSSPLIFWLRLTNNSPVSKLIKLKLSFRFTSLSEMDVQELISGETEKFNLSNGEIKQITNQDLFSETGNYGLDNYQINEDAANDLVESILTTGKLPSGKYEFIITAVDYETGDEYDDEIIEINLSNSTTLELMSPGEPAKMSGVMEIYTTFPLFQWESDAHEFRLRVCEKLSINSSPEDVMENEPRLDKIIQMDTNMQTTTYQYPPAGEFPLEEGRTYFWQVTAIVNSSNGPIEYPSEIWGFKIANLNMGQYTATHLQLINYLRLILGSELLGELFEEGGELENYSSTGLLMHNGTSINIEELNAIVNKFLSGNVEIKGFTIE